jgi:FkbM family methyltransferase
MRDEAVRVRNAVARRAVARWLTCVPRADLCRLGSKGAGWWVPESNIRPGAVAYCAGAGEDITFDLALLERGCKVTTFDPTPRAITHVRRTAPADARFRFEPVGWWDTDGEVRFYAPRNPAHVSHSALNLQHTSDFFTAPVRRVDRLMTALGDDHVNLIKMDIEGAELRVIPALIEHGPLPDVLCVEFDQPQPLRSLVATANALRDTGFDLNKIERWNFTFSRG